MVDDLSSSWAACFVLYAKVCLGTVGRFPRVNMDIKFIRKVDDNVGYVLCWVVSIYFRLKNVLRWKSVPSLDSEVKGILVQKYFGIGSTLHAIPLIRSLRGRYPNAKIYFLTIEWNKEVNEICDIFDYVLTLNVDSLPRFLLDSLKHIVFLMREKIDISIDLEFFARYTLLISCVSGSKQRVGFFLKHVRPGGIITDEIYFNHYRHISDVYFSFAEIMGIKRKKEYFTDTLPPFSKDEEIRLLGRLQLELDRPRILINANSSDLSKLRCWPSSYYVELLNLLIVEYPNYQYVMIGAKSEEVDVQNIIDASNASNRIINAAGETSLRDLFNLIESSFLLITNDSGPMHIAALYNRNVVSFFGPETPVVYGPRNKNSVVIDNKEIYCSPCLNVYNSKKSLYVKHDGKHCTQNDCLRAIRPLSVFETIKERFLIAHEY